MKKRLLIIAYFYPPLGGPGVQRPLKTIKYLKKIGWLVDVLTVDEIQFHSYDHTLLQQSQADNIYRVRSLDPMSLYKRLKPKSTEDKLYFNTPQNIKKMIRGLFPIDDKIGWYPFAFKKALELLRSKHYDAIVATVGPFTSGLIAFHLHQKTKVPFFIDYRDLWSLYTYPLYSTKLLLKHAEYIESKILKHAQGVFVVSNLMKQKMVNHFGEYLEDKTEVVYNGYDESDFQQVPIYKGDKRVDTFTIRYIGNIYSNNTVKYFIKALVELKNENKIPDNIIIEFIGNYYVETVNYLKTQCLAKHITIIPQVEHLKAVEYMQSADLLLLFISSKFGNDFMTGKFFEYLRAGKPILAMIPENGEPAMILRETGQSFICKMEDIEAIKKHLIDIFHLADTKKTVKLSSENIADFINQYSRENQTNIFNQLLMRKLP